MIATTLLLASVNIKSAFFVLSWSFMPRPAGRSGNKKFTKTYILSGVIQSFVSPSGDAVTLFFEEE